MENEKEALKRRNDDLKREIRARKKKQKKLNEENYYNDNLIKNAIQARVEAEALKKELEY